MPISNEDWRTIEQFTLHNLLTQESISTEDLLVARSGYDTTHKCGFIAAESIASAEWHKRIVLSFDKEGKKILRPSFSLYEMDTRTQRKR